MKVIRVTTVPCQQCGNDTLPGISDLCYSCRKIQSDEASRVARNSWSRVSQYLRNGKLVKEPCEVCGSMMDVQGHHENYFKPLDVHWMCRTHHLQYHAHFQSGKVSSL